MFRLFLCFTRSALWRAAWHPGAVLGSSASLLPALPTRQLTVSLVVRWAPVDMSIFHPPVVIIARCHSTVCSATEPVGLQIKGLGVVGHLAQAAAVRLLL
jgi:hypothetical protein